MKAGNTKTAADFGAEGGKARAKKLDAQKRSEIARTAAEARWIADGRALPRATHEGTLTIGTLDLPVAVLEGGIRVLTSRAMMTALGRPWKGTYKGTKLPNFVGARNLIPFIGKELIEVLEPVYYVPFKGKRVAGYRAELLPLVCDVYLNARLEEKLTQGQMPAAKQAEILVRSLSKIGIVGLVDEVTGYQDVRDRQALQALLDKYLKQEFAAWAKVFPDEFYQQIFRLRGWTWRGMKVNRPQVVAKYTNDIVYKRLAPGILQQLEERNPINARGYRAVRHHQWFTEDIGHPALAQHLYAVIGLMRIANTWDEFKRLLNRAYPKRGDSVQLALLPEAVASSIAP